MIVGNEAPDFTLYDTDKNKVTLSEYRGQNVLLLFFPLAFTSTCTEELCTVRDQLAFYNSSNTVVLGISVDSLFSLKKYKEEQRLTFKLLSDFNKEVSTAYDCLYESFFYEMKGVSKRASFIIDQSGIIRYAEILEDANENPDFIAINKFLETISIKAKNT